uniref:Uncharacterized protein n=1 Tax=Brassica oleracea var. oleracea TaxID=109376 RepID=A0A0D3BL67_BRAOL
HNTTDQRESKKRVHVRKLRHDHCEDAEDQEALQGSKWLCVIFRHNCNDPPSPPLPPSPPSPPSPTSLKRKREREKEREKERESSPELVAGATVCRDHVQLATTDKRPRPSSCSSRRDEAVDTNHASIGARTKPHSPPEDSPRRARATHAPPPSAGATTIKSSSFVLRLSRFSTDVQQLREVQVRQFSRELSVSSVMISRLSRSGYVTFLPPAHFKQSFHEFCYWRLFGVCVDRFRDVLVWTTDIGHWELFISIAVYQLCLEGRFVRIFIRDGATFLRCYPWDGLTVTASSSVGLPEGKSSDCWSRWKLLVHACYILRSYGSRTAVCRIVWRSRPTLVDRLSRRLEVSINRLRACVTEHFFGETNKYVIFGRNWCY